MVVFVGAHTHRATPVPIPNTAVKPVGPMILLQRESRSVPAFKQQPLDRKVEGFFVALILVSFSEPWRHIAPILHLISGYFAISREDIPRPPGGNSTGLLEGRRHRCGQPSA